MKYFKFLSILAIFSLLMACSLSKTERQARNTIDGTWILNTVDYEATGNFASTLFNDTSAQCFEGSKWFFRSNNSTGTYEILNSDCPTGVRNIRWAANEIGNDTGNYEFTMKFVDEKNKDIQKNVGYKMDLRYLDANTLTITETANVDGSPIKIVLNFSRLTQ